MDIKKEFAKKYPEMNYLAQLPRASKKAAEALERSQAGWDEGTTWIRPENVMDLFRLDPPARKPEDEEKELSACLEYTFCRVREIVLNTWATGISHDEMQNFLNVWAGSGKQSTFTIGGAKLEIYEAARIWNKANADSNEVYIPTTAEDLTF